MLNVERRTSVFLYASIKSNVGLLGKTLSINRGIIPLQKKFRLKHEIGQVLAGAHSRHVNLMDHQFGELQSFKEQMGRGGGKQKSLAGEAGSVEVAWDRNPQENKQLC